MRTWTLDVLQSASLAHANCSSRKAARITYQNQTQEVSSFISFELKDLLVLLMRLLKSIDAVCPRPAPALQFRVDLAKGPAEWQMMVVGVPPETEMGDCGALAVAQRWTGSNVHDLP